MAGKPSKTFSVLLQPTVKPIISLTTINLLTISHYDFKKRKRILIKKILLAVLISYTQQLFAQDTSIQESQTKQVSITDTTTMNMQRVYDESLLETYCLDHESFDSLRKIELEEGYVTIEKRSSGAKYGIWHLCLYDKNNSITDLRSYEYQGNFGRLSISQNQEYILIEDMKYRGHESFELINLDDIKKPIKVEIKANCLLNDRTEALKNLISFSPTSKKLAIIDCDFKVWIYDQKNTHEFILNHTQEAHHASAVMLIDDNMLLIVTNMGELVLYDINNRKYLWELTLVSHHAIRPANDDVFVYGLRTENLQSVLIARSNLNNHILVSFNGHVKLINMHNGALLSKEINRDQMTNEFNLSKEEFESFQEKNFISNHKDVMEGR